MSSTEEVKRSKSNVSRLVSPTTMGGKKVFRSIAGDPWDIIQGYMEKEGPETNFSGKNLRGAKYEDYDLHDCNLTGASFINCNLSGCSFINASMDNINLDNSYMNDVLLESASLVGARIRNVIMTNSDLSYAIFNGADLSRSNLSHSMINETSFKGALLRGTQLDMLKTPDNYTGEVISTFERADLTAARLSIRGLVKISGAFLIGSRIKDVTIIDKELKDTDFSSSVLISVTIRNVKLNDVYFNSTELMKVVFSNCELLNVCFKEFKHDHTYNVIPKSVKFINSNLTGCLFEHLGRSFIFLEKSNLTNCRFSSIIEEYTENVIKIGFSGKQSNIIGCNFKNCNLVYITELSSGHILNNCIFNNIKSLEGLNHVSLDDCYFTKTIIKDSFKESRIMNCVFLESLLFELQIIKSKLFANTFQQTSIEGTLVEMSDLIGNSFIKLEIVSSTIDKCEEFKDNTFSEVNFYKVGISRSNIYNNIFQNNISFYLLSVYSSEFNNKYLTKPSEIKMVKFKSCNIGKEDLLLFQLVITETLPDGSIIYRPQNTKSHEISSSEDKLLPKSPNLSDESEEEEEEKSSPESPESSDSSSSNKRKAPKKKIFLTTNWGENESTPPKSKRSIPRPVSSPQESESDDNRIKTKAKSLTPSSPVSDRSIKKSYLSTPSSEEKQPRKAKTKSSIKKSYLSSPESREKISSKQSRSPQPDSSSEDEVVIRSRRKASPKAKSPSSSDSSSEKEEVVIRSRKPSSSNSN